MKTDIQIAQATSLQPIQTIAKKLGIDEEDLILYGRDKAKIPLTYKSESKGKLILVTAINPTASGEGKSTVTIGLADAFAKLDKNVCIAMREPSLGPVFGVKGGAAGGGYAQLMPMVDLNLHFTGDLHALTSAHNLISAMIDNHLHFGNELNITQVVWPRALDINDRSLRQVTIGHGKINGPSRDDHFIITVASELMAVLCLSEDLEDLKNRLSSIIVGYADEKSITVEDLEVVGALMLILKDAIQPNLVQTLEGTPALVHGGPFANIAHGCNSIIATKTALSLADYVVTEAGFGADLGAEKFFDIKCRQGQLNPSAVVIVATIKALKLHGGVSKEHLKEENIEALSIGICNLAKHIETIQAFNMPYVIAINHFATDTSKEIEWLSNWCSQHQHPFSMVDVHQLGGEGGIDLAKKVLHVIDENRKIDYLYELDDLVEEKITKIVQKAYGGKDVHFSDAAKAKLPLFNDLYRDFMVCIAKTPESLSDKKELKGRPTDFTVHVKDLIVSKGARFIVVMAGNIIRMPGLPKVPAATKMVLKDDGEIEGLF